MKFIFLLVFSIFNIFAQEKWISLEKSEKKEIINKNNKTDLNLSQFQSINRLLQGVKIILPLIDKKNTTKKQNPNSEKKWFKINNVSMD